MKSMVRIMTIPGLDNSQRLEQVRISSMQMALQHQNRRRQAMLAKQLMSDMALVSAARSSKGH